MTNRLGGSATKKMIGFISLVTPAQKQFRATALIAGAFCGGGAGCATPLVKMGAYHGAGVGAGAVLIFALMAFTGAVGAAIGIALGALASSSALRFLSHAESGSRRIGRLIVLCSYGAAGLCGGSMLGTCGGLATTGVAGVVGFVVVVPLGIIGGAGYGFFRGRRALATLQLTPGVAQAGDAMPTSR